MASNIEWTGETWNPVTGCTEASTGCRNCYARGMSKRLGAMAKADRAAGRNPGKKAAYELSVLDDGRWSGVVQTVEDALTIPLRRKKPTTWFVNSMSDLFWGVEADLKVARQRGVEDPQPVPFEFIDRVFAVMTLCPQHTFQILTKRPERMEQYMLRRERNSAWMPTRKSTDDAFKWKTPSDRVYREVHHKPRSREVIERGMIWPLPNVWLGTSVENQKAADERIPHLLKCPAAVRFLSCEPLLGPVELTGRIDGLMILNGQHVKQTRISDDSEVAPNLHWIIAGGESGPGARPCDIGWIRSLVNQGKAAGVPVFVKQLGAVVHWNGIQGGYLDGTPNVWPKGTKHDEDVEHGKFRVCLNDKKGGDPSEWPEDLRVREMPGVKA